MINQKPRDLKLIDALDAMIRVPFKGQVWRVVHEEKDPIIGQRSGGRWDPGTFDVLYTSLEANGAIAEVNFILSALSPRPQKRIYKLYEITTAADKTLQLIDTSQLLELGVDMANYGNLNYTRTQEIGDTAYFLDFDGLIVPSARWSCNNLVLFTDRIAREDLKLNSSTAIDFEKWRLKNKETKSS